MLPDWPKARFTARIRAFRPPPTSGIGPGRSELLLPSPASLEINRPSSLLCFTSDNEALQALALGRHRMQRTLLSLVALLALGLGLIAGPHPCHATPSASHHESPAPQAETRSCHEVEPPAPVAVIASVPADGDCCGRDHDRACEIACQISVAVLDLEVGSLDVGPVAQAVAPDFDRSLPLFAHAIDHVPLA